MFISTGEFRVVLQQYKYKKQQINAVIKILPDKVKYFEKESENDFNWMTGQRWAKLESGLFRLLASLSNWPQDADKLKAELQIDHIKVSVSASTDLTRAAQKLLQSGLPEVSLEIVLKYMSHEDTTIVNDQSTKRKHNHIDKESKYKPVESNSRAHKEGSNRPAGSTHSSDKEADNETKNKPVGCSSPEKGSKYKASTSSSSTKTTKESSQVESRNKDDKFEGSKRGATDKPSRKRERRSISQGNQREKDTPKLVKRVENAARHGRKVRSSQTPPSHTNSAELQPERRSARSPVKPGRYNEFLMGTKKSNQKQLKPSKNSADSGSDRGSSHKHVGNRHKTDKDEKLDAKFGKFEQLDGARMNMKALKEINDMLDTPKPREVEILLLPDMDEAAVMNTFEAYRSDFDGLFKEREHKFQTLSYMDIDHCHIMDILSKNIRDSMIKKLGLVYSKSGPHGSLVLNGLLPLWIIRLFMDKYKLTQAEAALQIADQLKYHTYLKAVNNEPISSDLEE